MWRKMRKISPMLLMLLLGSMLYLAFNMQPVKAMGTIYIAADGSINPPEAPISSLDKITYTLTANLYDSIIVERSNIVVDGLFYAVQGDGTGNGFSLDDVVNVTIRNAIIEGCFDGIQLFNSSQNIIANNEVIGVSYEGVGVYYSSGNILTNNNIRDNQIGIAFNNCSDNSIIHNSFENNTQQVYVENSANNWDNGYPSGGNFWSDYAGSDTHSGPLQNQPGSDSIGDTPYDCGENNQDRYPLMQKWTNIAITAITCSKTALVQGQETNITAVVQNQGWDQVTTEVTLYANTTVLASFTNIALQGRSQVTLNFTWQTATFERAQYVISANTNAVSGEPDTGDNTLVYDKKVAITIAGDVNGDLTVDIYDAIALAGAYDSVPQTPSWNPNADINSDNIVDIYDAIVLSSTYGQKI
jgi:parallel beta-helix repeat protein